MNNRPVISVVVPVYNTSKYLPQCLGSLISQTFKNIEVICINDASTDDSGDVLKKCAVVDKRIRIIDGEKNKGLSFVRNRGINEAKGKYICFLDSDDSFDVSFLEDLYRAITLYQADVAMTKTRYVKDVVKEDNLKAQVLFSFGDKISSLPHGGCWNKIYRTDFIRENSICFPEGVYWEDNLFTLQVCYFSDKFVIVDGGSYNYNLKNNSSITRDNGKKEKRKKDSLVVAKMIMDFFKKQDCKKREFNKISHFCLKNFVELSYLEDRNYYKELKSILGNTFSLKRKRLKALKFCLVNWLKLYMLPLVYNKKKTNFKIDYYLLGKKICKRHKIFRFPVSTVTLFRPRVENENLIRELKKLEKFSYIPNRGNLGDMLIAAATYSFFKKNKLKYSEYNKYGENAKSIVYGGGGLWTADYENEWLEILPIFERANNILILPSSFNNVPKFVDILDERFVIFCREKKSYEYLIKQNTKAKIFLDVDMAFRLEHFPKRVVLSSKGRKLLKKIFWKKIHKKAYLMRKDRESLGDYISDIDISSISGGGMNITKDWAYFCAGMMLYLINFADVVVTDRLHVAISAFLLNKEVYILDNSNGKVLAVYENFFINYKNVHFCETLPCRESL